MDNRNTVKIRKYAWALVQSLYDDAERGIRISHWSAEQVDNLEKALKSDDEVGAERSGGDE
jgi:hypothetical protein